MARISLFSFCNESEKTMYYESIEISMDEALRKRLRTTGVLLLSIGGLGLLLPQIISITLSLLIASLLILAGLVIAYFTWYSYTRSALAWLKPFVLITLGLLVLFNPIAGAAALGLVLLVYFLLDGFAGITFALALRPMQGWVWTLISGLASLALAVVFIAGWPFNSLWLVGLFVGISLVFDGIALLMLTGKAGA